MLDALTQRMRSLVRGGVGRDPNRPRERRANDAFRRRVGASPPRTGTAGPPSHIVLIVVDSLRADVAADGPMPFLDSMGGGDAITPSTWTVPAITSLLAGRYPHVHGAMRQMDAFENSVADMTGLPEPADDATLLPEQAWRAGHETYGAFGFIVPFLALEGRFHTHALYDDAPADRVFADHEDWLLGRREQPTFSYLHLGDLHEPVDPPPDYWAAHGVDASIPDVSRWRFEDVVESTPTVDRYRTHRWRLYRAAAEYVDNELSAHVRRISAVVDDDLLVIVTADHGEGFWDQAPRDAEAFADPRPAYCVGHGGTPFEALTRVPLALSDPTGTLTPANDRRTTLIDVAPTVLDAMGVSASDDTDGVPISRCVPADRRVIVEGTRYGYEKKCIYGDGCKLIVSPGDDVVLTLDVPEETETTVPDSTVSSLVADLPAWPGTSGRGSGVPADVEHRLERLGYRA